MIDDRQTQAVAIFVYFHRHLVIMMSKLTEFRRKHFSSVNEKQEIVNNGLRARLPAG